MRLSVLLFLAGLGVGGGAIALTRGRAVARPLAEDRVEELEFRLERLERMLQAIEALPEDLRTAIVLRELEGLSYEDIAAAMDCPVGTVRSRIYRAREAIDRKLSDVFEGGLGRAEESG